jgi:hypothetical protein
MNKLKFLNPPLLEHFENPVENDDETPKRSKR